MSGRFVALIAAGLIPLVLFGTDGARAVLILFAWLALCLVLGVIDAIAAASPRRLRIERDVPRQIRFGEVARAVLGLTNTGKRTLRATVRDAWDPSAGAPRMRERVRIPSGERRAVTIELRPTRRGERRAHHVTIRSWGPLGLWARQATLAAPGRLLVLPPFNSRKHLPSRLAKLRELDGQTQLMVRGQGTEFDSLREYVRGDDVRSIDWRATARRQDLVVRTWRPERDRRVVVLIDTGRLSAARVREADGPGLGQAAGPDGGHGIDDEVRLDTGIESALLLAALATRAGDRVDLVAFDRRVRGRVQGASGQTLLNRMVETMADVEPELIETDWSMAPGLVQSVTTHRSLVVILTTPDGVGAGSDLLDVLPQLTRRHVVLIASVLDPEVAAATRDRSDREAVYRAAAAERAALDRARLHLAMRRFGADVVEATPAALPPAVADRYLEYKRAGKL